MMGSDHAPRSLSGEPLAGDSAVRFIFVDEAGTSALEPYTVVVGIVLHADAHLMAAEARLNEILGGVPEPYKADFTSCHATDVWNNPKYRPEWELTDRLAFLCEIMRIPRSMGMAVSMAIVSQDAPDNAGLTALGMSSEQQQHLLAFRSCLGRADKYIREYAHPREVATVIAEDVRNMRRYLAETTSGMRGQFGPTHRPPADQIDRSLGFNTQETQDRITRIRQSIHFVGKDEEPMTQVADACAFGLRRFFSGLEFGDQFGHAVMGSLPNRDDYGRPHSAQTLYWHPNKDQIIQPFSAV